MVKAFFIGLLIGFAGGWAVVYFYSGKAIAAGREYLGKAEAALKKVL